MTDGGFGHDVHEAVDESVAGAEDGDEAGLGGGEALGGHLFERGCDGVLFDGEMFGGLVGEEPGGLAKDAAKGGEGGGDVAQAGELVVNKRVVDNGEFAHREKCRLGVFVFSFCFGEFFFHLGLLKGVGEFLDLSLHDAFHIVGGVVDAVVGDAGLGKVVGADFFGAVAGTDLGTARGGVFLGFFLHFDFVKFGAQDFEAEGFVLGLGASVLTLHLQAGGEVGDLDSGVGGIDVLSAGASGAGGLDVEVFGLEDDVDFLRLGHDCDGAGGGVNAALGLGGGDALHAVDAGLVFEVAEDFFAGDFDDHFLKSAHVGGGGVEVLRFPATVGGIVLIEAEKFAGEEGGFVAASAGADFEKGVAFFGGVAGEEGVLHFGAEALNFFFQLRDFLGGHFGKFVGAFGELAVVFQFGLEVLKVVPHPEDLFDRLVLAGEGGGAFLVGEKLGFGHCGFDFVEPCAPFGDERAVIHDLGGRFWRRGPLVKDALGELTEYCRAEVAVGTISWLILSGDAVNPSPRDASRSFSDSPIV